MATIPSLALIPSGVKASKVYSVLPTDGTGDFDFARSGNATRVNSEGLIELVSTNVPRLNYPLIDGVVSGCPSLLLEPERRNLIQYSEDFSNDYWTKSGSSAVSGFTSPDGDLNASKIVSTAILGTHSFQDAPTTTSSGIYTASCLFKKGEYNFGLIRVFANSAADRYSVLINLNDGTFENSYTVGSPTGTDYKIEPLLNGWYRLSASITHTSGSVSLTISGSDTNNPSIAGGLPTYQGDGTSGIYIWGAQLEQGSYPTSYIPNYGTALGVTRSAETCNGAGDASTFNDSEGVLFAEISALANDLTFRLISLSDGTTSNRLSLGYRSTSNAIYCEIRNANVTQAFLITTINDIKTKSKVSVKYKENDFAMWVNGFEVSTDTSGITPVNLSKINFDSGQINGSFFYGNTKQIKYFPTALNDSDLETLTSWDSFSDMATSQLYTIE